MPNGSRAQVCRMGKAKASVLPVPVGEEARMSAPDRMGGIGWSWIGVGFVMERVRRVERSQGERARAVKEVVVVRLLDALRGWRMDGSSARSSAERSGGLSWPTCLFFREGAVTFTSMASKSRMLSGLG